MDLRTTVALLPTPKATNNENQQSLDRYGPNLGMVIVEALLEALRLDPTANDIVPLEPLS
jgi:hypothetical protein